MAVRVKMSLDWLSITGKVNKLEGDDSSDYLLARVNLCRRILSGLGYKSPTLQTLPSAKYYATSFVDKQTGVRVNLGENLSTQGWQVVLSGKALNSFDAHEHLLNFLSVWKGKVTRTDFAIDLIDSGLSVMKFADEYREEHGDDGAKSFSFIKSRSGETAYVGSRTSERMLRFYDKGGEQGVPVDWLRVELECKGSYAQRMAETYVHDFLACVADTASYLQTKESGLGLLLSAISAGMVAERVCKPRAVTDRVKWLNGQVLQSYFKLCEDDLDAARDVWEKFHQTYMAYAVYAAFNEANSKIQKSLVQSDL